LGAEWRQRLLGIDAVFEEKEVDVRMPAEQADQFRTAVAAKADDTHVVSF
jgi:hypothetical protein